MTHYDRSVRERVVGLVEAANLSATEAGRRYGVPPVTARRWLRQYRETGEVGRRVGTGLWRVSTEAQDAELVNQAKETPFCSSVQLKRATNFPGCSRTVRNRLRDAGLRSHRAAVKDRLSEDHRLYRLAFAEENLHRDWGNVIFSDESVFSSANDGPVRVYRPRGTRHYPAYVHECTRSGRVSVMCWGWISSRGIGVLHRIQDRLDGTQYLHILRDIMVPSVRQMYPDGEIYFQHDNSSVHKSKLVQEWLAQQEEFQVLDWPPRGADLNPIENMWAETKRVMAENWPDPPPSTTDALWDVVLDAWEEIAQSPNYSSTLVASLPRRLQAVTESNGFWSSY